MTAVAMVINNKIMQQEFILGVTLLCNAVTIIFMINEIKK